MRVRGPGAFGLAALAATASAGCANQTTIHTVPLGAQVYVDGDLCGQSPCVYHSRYGFPDRIRIQLEKDGFAPAEFFLDSEPPLASYALYVFGSYVFHTFPKEYRFRLRPVAGGAAGAAAPPRSAPTAPAAAPGSPPAPAPAASPPLPPAPEAPLSPSSPRPEGQPPAPER